MIAERNNGFARTNRKPANTSLALRRDAAGAGTLTGIVVNMAMKMNCPTAANANDTVAAPVAAINMPPMAGPLIAAS